VTENREQPASQKPTQFPVRSIVLWVLCLLFASVSLGTSLYLTRFQSSDKIPGDFFPRWYGTREMILHHRNPYGSGVSSEIKQIVYRNVPGESHRDEQRFAYPVYVAVMIFPLIFIPFSYATIIVKILLAAATAASILFWLKATQWDPPIGVKTAIVVLTFSSLGVVQGIRLQQLSLLVAFLLALSTWFVVSGRLKDAGALLALATIKPQMVLFVLAWVVVWCLLKWGERKTLLISFAMAMLFLCIIGQLLQPGWIRNFAEGVVSYWHYASPDSIVTAGFGKTIGFGLSILIAMAVCAIAARRRDDFVFVTALILAFTVLCSPALGTALHCEVLLLPIVMLLIKSRQDPSPGHSLVLD